MNHNSRLSAGNSSWAENDDVYFDVDPLAHQLWPTPPPLTPALSPAQPSYVAGGSRLQPRQGLFDERTVDLVDSPARTRGTQLLQIGSVGGGDRLAGRQHHYDISGGQTALRDAAVLTEVGDLSRKERALLREGDRLQTGCTLVNSVLARPVMPPLAGGGSVVPSGPPATSTATLERALLMKEQTIRELHAGKDNLASELAACTHLLFDHCVMNYHELLLSQHRSLVAVAVQLTSEACRCLHEQEAQLCGKDDRAQEAKRRDAHFQEELAFVSRSMEKEWRHKVDVLAAEVRKSQDALVGAQDAADRLVAENTDLKAQLADLQRQQQLPLSSAAGARGRAGGRHRSPLKTQKFLSDAALTRQLRKSERGTVATSDDNDNSENDSLLHWKIEALAFAKEHDELVESWMASEAMNATLRAHQMGQARDMAALRSELQRLRTLLRDSVEAVYERARLGDKNEAKSSGRGSERDGSVSPPRVPSTPNARGRTSGPPNCSALEALAATSGSPSVADEHDDNNQSALAICSSAALTVVSGTAPAADWRQFQLDFIETMQDEQERLLGEMETAAKTLAARLCHAPLPSCSPASPCDVPVEAPSPPTLLDWRRCRGSLMTSTSFYAAVAAQAQSTLKHFKRKLEVLEANRAANGEWNARVAQKVLGTDHAAALASLVDCMNELAVPDSKKVASLV